MPGGEARRLALAAVAAAALLIAVLALLRAGLGVSTPLVVVEGNSMIPTLYSGDLVVIHRPPPSEIHVGDIIVYRSPFTGRLVIHRVVAVEKLVKQGRVVYRYVTKGDNNPVDDVKQGLEPRGGIPYSDVLGVVVSLRVNGEAAPVRVPYLGLLTRLVKG